MSRYISEDIIDRVRNSVDIVELVSRYIPLKKAGANHKALCPFHKEKTPSFTVSPSRQSFHCFGCGKGGNVFHFLMAMDRVSFPEAIRTLAREAHIEIPDASPPTPEAEVEKDQRAALYEANRRAADFFVRKLASPTGKSAREYIATRGITDEMAARCQLGYSPDSWDALLNAAAAAGIVPGTLHAAGLAVKREDGSGCYDRFRNRLMFPIFDTQDRVIGFGARTMADDDVKYINTPETPIFSKGRNLYGLNWARKTILDTKRVAVVEGYTDVIMAHQHGCTGVVATLGTALTRDHIQLLRRYAERVDVVFDSDPAGEQAAERSMEIFLDEEAGDFVAAGLDVRIATFQGGKDPCDIIASQGPEAFTNAVDAAVDVFTRKIEIASSRHDTDTVAGKTKAVDDVLSLAAQVPNAVGRQLTLDAAIRMLSDKFSVDDRVLRARFDQIQRRKRTRVRPADEPPKPARTFDPAERGILEALLSAPDIAPQMLDEFQPDDFESEELRELIGRMQELYKAEGTINPSRLLGMLDDPDMASLVSGIISGPARPDIEEAALDCKRAILRKRTEKQIRRIRDELEKAKASGDETLKDDLNTRYLKLQRQVHAL